MIKNIGRKLLSAVLTLAMVLTLLPVLTVPAKAAGATFKFINGTDGSVVYGNPMTTTWNESGVSYPLDFTVTGAYPGEICGTATLFPVRNGGHGWYASNSNAATTVSVTISIHGGYTFDLKGFELYDGNTFAPQTYMLETPKTDSKITGSLPVYNNDPTDNTTFITFSNLNTGATGAAYSGISSFTVSVTANSGNPTAIDISDLIVDNIIPPPTLTSATYDAGSGVLAVTGADMTAGDTIAVNKLTLTGEGGEPYTLTTGNVSASSATAFSVTLNATDQAAVNQILTKNGTTSTSGTNYYLSAADDWDGNFVTGDTSDANNPVAVINVAVPTITSATYDAGTGVLAVTGTNFLKKSGGANDIDVSKLTITGEGGVYYTLTSSSVEITSGTAFSVSLNATDKDRVNQILNKNGASSTSGTSYNIAAAEDWAAGADSAVVVADTTGNGITVSNVAVPAISSATYDSASGTLVVTGTGLVKKTGVINDIDASMLTFTGEGGATYALSDTSDIDITSGTAFTVTLSATDKTAVNQILNKNGTSSKDGTTYNLAAAEDWAAGADSAVVVADLTGNGITVSNAAPSVTSISPTVGSMAGGTSVTITGTNFTDATAVLFGTTPASAFTVNSSTQITATSPAGSGTVHVTVTTPVGTSAAHTSDQFTYNAAPVITTTGGSTSFTEATSGTSTPVAVDGGVTVSDADSTTLASGTVSITGNFRSSEDVLAFTNVGSTMGNISVSSYDAGTGILTLTSSGATATLAQWQSALRAVTYTDTSHTPSTATRTISFTINDGSLSSNTATRTVTVTATNNTPVVTTSGGSTGYTVVLSSAVIDSNLTVSDADNTTLSNAVISVTDDKNVFITGDTLIFVNTSSALYGNIVGSYNSATGVLTLTSSGAMATVAQWQNALRAITYTNSFVSTQTATRVVSFTVNDGTSSSTASTKTVNIAIVNEPPVVSSIDRFSPASASTNAASVTYRVTFSKAVTGVDTSDFTLFKTGTVSGTIASVSSASGTVIDVTVSTISGDGTLRLDLKGSGTGIQDSTSQNISGGFTSGQIYTVDTTAPTGTLSINNGAAYTTSLDVTLSITSSDGTGSGVSQMRFSLDGSSWSPWETIKNTKNPMISASYGIVTMYLQLKDNAGNISGNISDTITYKSQPAASNSTKGGIEDVTVSFTSSDFSFSNADLIPLNKVKITSLPLNGTLKLGSTAISANDEISAANLSQISFVPDKNWNGSTSLKWAGYDGTLWTAEATVTITLSDDGVTEASATSNTISVSPSSVSQGAAVTITASGDRQSAAGTVAGDEKYVPTTWSSSESGKSGSFTLSGGAYTASYTPSIGGTITITATYQKMIWNGTSWDNSTTDTKTATLTVNSSSGGAGGTSGTSDNNGAVVIVNGQKQDAGTSSTQTIGGQTVTTVTVDDTKLDKILDNSGPNPTVTLPVSGGSDVVVGVLNGQTVKNMEQKEAVLEIKTDNVTYTLPASQINIDSVSAQIGSSVSLKDIKVSVKIAEPSADTVKIIEDTANKNSYQLVVKPVEFEITCTSGSRTIDVSKFNGYVERTIAIPDGIDPAKITTGIVLNADGTFRHVPTQIVVIGGKYFAKINSLTNSTYSVIWNPVEFKDVSAHWAKSAINDMGSRMVVTGVGNGNYDPSRSITRAEFAAIVVRALGLAQGTAKSVFSDVALTDWFSGYVDTASSYGLITGYTAAAYGPNDTITREQAMAILARAMELTGLKVSLTDGEVNTLLSGYADGAEVSDYAKKSVAMCIKSGVVSGTSATKLTPKAYVTRAEVAVMVKRLLQQSGLI